MKLSFTLLGLLVAFHTYANNCHPHADHSLPLYDSGYLEVPLDYQNPDGETTKLYWEKFHGKDSNLTPVIFLSGGPAPTFSIMGQRCCRKEKWPLLISSKISSMTETSLCLITAVSIVQISSIVSTILKAKNNSTIYRLWPTTCAH